ncbi:MAG: T9SS type A sorting domain-containing protein [Bacteroidales bacterium]|nr:T9SS type A sorting domain-containing protein [Bacteroidales bacterium]
MKKLIPILFVCMSMMAYGQDYKLFNANSRKLFASHPDADSTYGIAFDSTAIIMADSLYYNFTGLDEWFEPDTCEFWGGTACIKQDKPSWIGWKAVRTNEGIYSFLVNEDMALAFDFEIPVGDSIHFYVDPTQIFYLVNKGRDTTTILGVPDSARFYRIAHYDDEGNPINSALHQEQIIIGKEMGLTRFFRLNGFPELLEPVYLVANNSPEAGLVKITNEILYDYQPGDVIQYQDYYSMPDGPPWNNYEKYIKRHILNRTETQDSLIYNVRRTVFELGEEDEVVDTITISYYKYEVIDEIPYHYIDQDQFLHDHQLYQKVFCDTSLWSYVETPEYLTYCQADNCWGPYDTFGPPPQQVTNYVMGLGLYRYYESVVSPDNHYTINYEIVYFKKNGMECGEEVIVGTKEPLKVKETFHLYPNPAYNQLAVEIIGIPNGTLIITNLSGQSIMQTTFNTSLFNLDINHLSPGVYLVKLISGNTAAVRKLVVE